MAHLLARPRWLAGHLLALIAVIAFVSLGQWQLRRHEEVRQLQGRVEESRAIEPVDIRRSGMLRRVLAVGVFDHEHEVRVLRSEAGQSGERVITPLVLSEGDAVLVDRGWVPAGASLPRSTDPVRLTGHIWPAEEGSWLPDSLTPGQVVRRIDPAVLQPFVTYELLLGIYLIEGDEPPTIPSRPHLSYAVQWFLFTGVVLVGYPLLLRRVRRRDHLAVP
jgi:cytochrome oxidase assembly protein ShyY1